MVELSPRKLAVILHADVIGSTALVQCDEALAHDRIRDAFHRFSTTIHTYNGHALELRGDALVAEFNRASDAVEASLAFQAENTRFNSTLEDDIRPNLRIGISLGEVVVADNTVTGEGVVVAQRLEQLASGGGVCIQGAIYEAVPGRLPFDYESLGEQELKGFSEPTRVYTVTLKSGGKIPAPESTGAPVDARPELLDRPSIAVLPFTNMSGDPEQEYFSDGMTEDIITELSRYRDVFVIARHSTLVYKDKVIDVKRIGNDLGVLYVLEGSVRRVSNRVRVTAQLIEAETAHHLWAERYDRTLDSLFALQDELVRAILTSLNRRLDEAEMARAMRKRPCSLDAHDHYRRSWSLLEHMNKTDNLAAREEAEAAIRLDPEYAGGYVSAALTYIVEGLQCWDTDPIAALKRGRTYALRAVALDDRFFWSHTTLGAAETWLGNHDKAVAELERGVELNPNHADCLAFLSAALNFAGRPEEGLRAIHSAIERNPYHPGYYLAMLGRAQFMLGHYLEAIEALERLVNAMPEFTVGRAMLAATYAAMDRDADASEQIQAILEITPSFTLTTISHANPYKQPEDLEHYLSLLRKAGMPE